MTPDERFWAKVNKGDGCWEWMAARSEGYGSVWRDGRSKRAHRVAWEIVNGPIPDDLVVCHRCDNPPCVNPEHLYLGTQKDNMADREARGRGNRDIEKLKRSRRLGYNTHNAVLSPMEAEDIRALSAYGWSQPRLADLYGVSKSAIGMVLRGQTWAIPA